MFVRRIAMRKIVLHETGQRTELRNITAEEIDPMHPAKHATDVSFSRQNRFENFTRFLCILKSACDLPEMAGHQIHQLRAKIDIVFLRDLKSAHHLDGVLLKKSALIGVKLAIANQK